MNVSKEKEKAGTLRIAVSIAANEQEDAWKNRLHTDELRKVTCN